MSDNLSGIPGLAQQETQDSGIPGLGETTRSQAESVAKLQEQEELLPKGSQPQDPNMADVHVPAVPPGDQPVQTVGPREEKEENQADTQGCGMDVDSFDNTNMQEDDMHVDGILKHETVVAKQDSEVTSTHQEPLAPQIKSESAAGTIKEKPEAVEIKNDTEALNITHESTTNYMEEESEDTNMDAPASPDLIGPLDAALERSERSMTASIQETEGNEPNGDHPEWEYDSDPYVSSSDSSPDEDSDEDSDEDDGDHPLLSIEETVRLLMASADADEEGNDRSRSGDKPIRSKHEDPELVLPKPDLVIGPDMEIKLLGEIKDIVEQRTVVIKGIAPGRERVVGLDAVLCKEDRTVIGALADIIGPVAKEPLYTVGFRTAEEIKELELSKGTPIYYPVDHANFVFTQQLRHVKGTDASNLHDEEVPEDEMEFSDDEKEREYKAQKKAEKQSKRRGGLPSNQRRASPSAVSTATSATLNYDEDEEGPYRPLARPTNFGSSNPLPARPDRSGYQNRGRGNRDRPIATPRGRDWNRAGHRGNDRPAPQEGVPLGATTNMWQHQQSGLLAQHNAQAAPLPLGATPHQWSSNPGTAAPFNFAVPPPPQFGQYQHQYSQNTGANHQPAWNQHSNQQFAFPVPPVANAQVPPPPFPPLGIPVPPPNLTSPLSADQQRALHATLLRLVNGQNQQVQQQSQNQQQPQGYQHGQSAQQGYSHQPISGYQQGPNPQQAQYQQSQQYQQNQHGYSANPPPQGRNQ